MSIIIILIITIILIVTIILTIIVTRYDKIIETAIKEINKMIFAEIQQEILDFDNLWMNPNNNVIDIITSSLKSSFEVSIHSSIYDSSCHCHCHCYCYCYCYDYYF